MKKLSVVLTTFLCMILIASYAHAEKRSVLMWSFAANNVEEWKNREADIEAKFNIDLTIETVAQNAFIQKLQAVMMSKKGIPDIIEWKIEDNKILNANPRKSFALPLDTYIEQSDTFKNVVEGRVDWVKYGGHVYGLPHDVHPVVLIYNDTIWKSVGVDVAKIETWEEFISESEKLTKEKADGKSIHYALPYGNDGLNNTMFMLWQQSGSQILDKTGKPTFTSPEFVSFVKKWMEWQKSGAFTAWDWGNFAALLANGTLCSYTSPDWWVPQVNDASKKYDFKVRKLPLYMESGPKTASWGGSFLAIPTGTKKPEEIYSIMEYMQYDEKAMVDRWDTTTMLPPFEKIWEDPAFAKGDTRFGGQKLGEIMVSGARKMPKINGGDVFWDAINDFSTEYSEIISGRKTVEEALESTQKKAMSRIK